MLEGSCYGLSWLTRGSWRLAGTSYPGKNKKTKSPLCIESQVLLWQTQPAEQKIYWLAHFKEVFIPHSLHWAQKHADTSTLQEEFEPRDRQYTSMRSQCWQLAVRQCQGDRTASVAKVLLWFHYSYGRSSVSSPPLFGRRRVPGVVNGIFLSASGRGWGLASCGPPPPGGLGNPPEVASSRNYIKMYFFLTCSVMKVCVRQTIEIRQ